jgi:hypothetical protein
MTAYSLMQMAQLGTSPRSLGDLGERFFASVIFLGLGLVGVWGSRKTFVDPMAKPRRFMTTRWFSNSVKGRRKQCVFGIFYSTFYSTFLVLSSPLWFIVHNRPLVLSLAVAAAIIAGVASTFLIPRIPVNPKKHRPAMKQ